MLRLARFCLPLLAAAATVLAEPPVARPTLLKLSLESSIQGALAKNFAIEVQKFEPKIAQQNVTRQLGRFDPVFDVTAERGEDSRRDLYVNGLHLDNHDVNRLDRLSAGISGPTITGLTYDIGLGSRNNLGIFNRFIDDYETSASVSLRQPLLRDFGPTANLAQIRIARNNVLASEWQLKQRIIDIITETNFVYNELHLAHENMLVAERSRERARSLLHDNQARMQIGTGVALDVTEARAEVAAREEGVILALRSVRDNENLLKRLVTNDIERLLSVEVEIATPPSPDFRADVQAGVQDALALRPDYRQAVLEIERRNITLAFEKNQALPRFDLVGSLALLGFDNDFGTALSRIPKRDQTAWTLGAIVSIPIPNREGRGRKTAAALEAAKSLVALKDLEQQVIVDVDNASGQIVTSRERIASTQEARRLSEESLKAGEDRLRAGAGTTFEVLQLQEKLTTAEAAQLRARSDYNKAVYEYYRQTGRTLQVHRVSLNRNARVGRQQI